MVKIRKYFTLNDFLVKFYSAVTKKDTLLGYTGKFVPAYNKLFDKGVLLRTMQQYDNPKGLRVLNGFLYDTDFTPVADLLVARYEYDAICYKDYYPDIEEEPTGNFTMDVEEGVGTLGSGKCVSKIESDAYNFLIKLMEIYNATKDRYLTLLGFYSAQSSHLLDQINSKTTMRYNDTPQNGGDWSDDNHTTNITQNETNTDVLPLMDRLNTVQNSYRNLVKDWADEFKGLFMFVPEDEVNE